MEFFDMIGKKATEAYKLTADKTGKIAKEAKLKLKISELRSQINDIYNEIGKKVYEKHIREEINIQKELEEQCIKIDVLSDEIENMLQECLILRDKKQCPNCNSQIEKEDQFCPKCGKKQEQELTKEVEVIETLENTKINQDEEQHDNFVEENSKEDLKKTIEVESAMDTTNKVEIETSDLVENLKESNYDDLDSEEK